MTCDKGRGYVSAERNKQLLQPAIGVIAIDSIYSPVLKVNYTVENTRVGQITDYDKLTLEVWTTVQFPHRKPYLSAPRSSTSISIFLSIFLMIFMTLRLWLLRVTVARKGPGDDH